MCIGVLVCVGVCVYTAAWFFLICSRKGALLLRGWQTRFEGEFSAEESAVYGSHTAGSLTKKIEGKKVRKILQNK